MVGQSSIGEEYIIHVYTLVAECTCSFMMCVCIYTMYILWDIYIVAKFTSYMYVCRYNYTYTYVQISVYRTCVYAKHSK